MDERIIREKKVTVYQIRKSLRTLGLKLEDYVTINEEKTKKFSKHTNEGYTLYTYNYIKRSDLKEGEEFKEVVLQDKDKKVKEFIKSMSTVSKTKPSLIWFFQRQKKLNSSEYSYIEGEKREKNNARTFFVFKNDVAPKGALPLDEVLVVNKRTAMPRSSNYLEETKELKTREVKCLKCKKEFTTELDSLGVPYKRICQSCTEINKNFVHKNNNKLHL